MTSNHLPTLTIRGDGLGRTTKVELNGRPLPASQLTLEFNAQDFTRATIVLAVQPDVETQTLIERATIVQPDDETPAP